jgi:hypothetical protein
MRSTLLSFGLAGLVALGSMGLGTKPAEAHGGVIVGVIVGTIIAGALAGGWHRHHHRYDHRYY